MPAARVCRVILLLTGGCGRTQARDLGYSSAALLQQLDAASLSQRIELTVGSLHRVQGALAPRPAAGDSAVRRGAPGFSSLPHAVALRIFAALPADARARAGLVSRAWRDAIAEPTVWTRLDLSPRSGVAQPASDALLRGAAARARGQLISLCLEECDADAVSEDVVLEVLTVNTGSLREMVYTYEGNIFNTIEDIEAILRAAPHLRSFDTDAVLSLEDATRVLKNEPPFQPVRLSCLDLDPPAEGVVVGEDALLAFAAAVSAQASLQTLSLDTLTLSPVVWDALSSAALTCRLHHLEFDRCGLSPACIPALARLIRGGSLTTVLIYNHGAQLLDAAAAEQLGNAFAASRQLLEVDLCGVRLWQDNDAAVVVLRSLTGHSRVVYAA